MTATNQIQSTTDYEQFNVLGGNRSVNQHHVKRLVKQIETSGNITDVSPIIVNERYEVIDGQHRLQAAKKTGISVSYLVKPGLNVEDALQMNVASKTWTPYDYLNLYVSKKYKGYKKFAEILEDYSWATVGIILMVITNGDPSGMLKKFKLGDLDDFDAEDVTDKLDKIEQLARLNPVFIQRNLVRAYLTALSTPNFSHDRFYNNLKDSGSVFRAHMFWFDNVNPIMQIHDKNIVRI